MTTLPDGILLNPQAAGFQTIFFNGWVSDQTAMALIQRIITAIREGKKGVWVGVQSGGGEPGAARLVDEFLSSTDFPAASHAIDVFSEGASLAASFPNRTIAPAGKIGFHQASMNVVAGGYPESKIADLLNQVRGHNSAMIAHLVKNLGLPDKVVTRWIYDGAIFVGQGAVEAGIARLSTSPTHPRPLEHTIMNATR